MRRTILTGALAGLAGGLAMKAVVRFGDPAAFGLSAKTDARSAHELWRRMEWGPVEERQAAFIGAALHYAFAVASGALYGMAADRFPSIRLGKGTAFGATLWLAGDELAVSAAGLEDPQETAMLSHLSALAAHLFYGFIVDAGTRMI